MLVYYAFFGFLIVLAATDDGRRSFVYWTAFVSMYMFSAFRFEVGCDWPNYLLNYMVQQDRDWHDAITSTNPSHWLFLQFMSMLELNYIWLNIFTSTIFFIGLNAVASRSVSPTLFIVAAFPVLIINMPMAAVKQAAAIGFVMLAILAYIDNRLVKAVLFIILGSTFHSSAIIFLLFIPFHFLSFNSVNVILGAISSLPLMFVISQSEQASLASSRYINTDIDAAGAVFRVSFLMLINSVFFVFLATRWKSRFPSSFKWVSIGCFGGASLILILPLSSVIADRMAYYFYIFFCATISSIRQLGGEYKNLVYTLVMGAMIVYFTGWTIMSRHFNSCYIPYNNIIFNA